MYSITISSQPPRESFNPGITNFFSVAFSIVSEEDEFHYKEGLPGSSSPSETSVAKLNFEAELVCIQTIQLPQGTRITNISPAAGHLSSSSLYPACKAPYLLVTSDTDDSIRFWCCEKNFNVKEKNKFRWKEWNMISENHPSELGVEGKRVIFKNHLS